MNNITKDLFHLHYYHHHSATCHFIPLVLILFSCVLKTISWTRVSRFQNHDKNVVNKE